MHYAIGFKLSVIFNSRKTNHDVIKVFFDLMVWFESHETAFVTNILGIKKRFEFFKILLVLIIFYKMITDNDAFLKFWFHFVRSFNSWKPGHFGEGSSRPQSSLHQNDRASSY